MKRTKTIISLIALVAILGFTLAACDGDPDDDELLDLTGTITITPADTAEINQELTAVYTGGTETVTYQWKKGDVVVDDPPTTDPTKYTPTVVGRYTVTVSAAGYNSKTSDPVEVTLPNLPGTITISPDIDVEINTELTATYSGGGEETVTYQWNRNGTVVDDPPTTEPTKYTPTQPGNYTVTVSAEGFNPKTSDPPVEVTLPNLTGNITIEAYNVILDGLPNVDEELTAVYSGGSETVTYQWKRNGSDITGATDGDYTPTKSGSYTVTVSADGFNPKTSEPFAVNHFLLISEGSWKEPTNPDYNAGWFTNPDMPNQAGQRTFPDNGYVVYTPGPNQWPHTIHQEPLWYVIWTEYKLQSDRYWYMMNHNSGYTYLVNETLDITDLGPDFLEFDIKVSNVTHFNSTGELWVYVIGEPNNDSNTVSHPNRVSGRWNIRAYNDPSLITTDWNTIRIPLNEKDPSRPDTHYNPSDGTFSGFKGFWRADIAIQGLPDTDFTASFRNLRLTKVDD